MARILILTPQLPIPPQALTGLSQGTTIRNYHLVTGLARRHTIDLLSFVGPAEAEIGKGGDPTGLLLPHCRRVFVEQMPVRTLAARARDTLSRSLPDMALRLSSAAMARRFAEVLAESHYDVLQVEGIEMAPYVMAMTRPRPRLVFDDHNAEYVLQKRAFLTDVRRPRRWVAAAYSLVQWQKLARYERRVCETVDRVVAVSEADRTALQRLSPGLHVTVVPNGVDLAFNRPGAVTPLAGMGANALVFTGKMDYRPNVDAAIWFADAVLPLVRSRVPDARLYLVGQQPHTRVTALAGRPGITVTGRVPDVRPYIAGAAVYVVPLRIGGGTRLKVLEAMAMGQAIVSTRLGCDGFAFESGRQARFADEPAAFAAAVIDLLVDRRQAQALGQAARACVEAHFGWDALVPRFEELYE